MCVTLSSEYMKADSAMAHTGKSQTEPSRQHPNMFELKDSTAVRHILQIWGCIKVSLKTHLLNDWVRDVVLLTNI